MQLLFVCIHKSHKTCGVQYAYYVFVLFSASSTYLLFKILNLIFISFLLNSIFLIFNPLSPYYFTFPKCVQITAKGRTNIELREQFILADGVSQTMTAFRPKTSASSPISGSSGSSLRTPAGPITKVFLLLHTFPASIPTHLH